MTEIERGAVMDILADVIAEHLLSEVGSEWIAYHGVKGTIDMTDDELIAKMKEYDITIEYCLEHSAIDNEPVKINKDALPETLRHLVKEES